jgi:predicted O-methyltransferase YrrM
MHPRSVVLVDNVLWDGFIANDADQSHDTLALRAFNDAMLADPRVDIALLPIGDGVSMITLAR